MEDATIRPMLGRNLSIERDGSQRLWEVLIIERDSMGKRVEGYAHERVHGSNLTYAEAGAIAGEFNRELNKQRADKWEEDFRVQD